MDRATQTGALSLCSGTWGQRVNVASGHRAGGLPGRVEVERRLSAVGAGCATGAGSIGPRVRPAQRPRGGRAVTRLSTLPRGSAWGTGWGSLSAWEGRGHWERKQSGSMLHSDHWQPCARRGGRQTYGLDRVSRQSRRGASACPAPGARGRGLSGGGSFLVPARLPQRWQREVL